MSSRDWLLRIQDILDAVADIQAYTASIDFEDFKTDRKIIQAVLYNFVIIGEASANIPDEIQLLYPRVPWRLMNDMRNVMAHEYFQVDLNIVWGTIQNNFSSLTLQLEKIVTQEARE